MFYEVKRVNIWSVAKVSFVLGGLLGFIAGVFLWMGAGILSQLPLSDAEAMDELQNFGASMPFILAILYAVGFMIGNSIMAGAYNVLAGMVGGFELKLVATPVDEPAAQWAPPPQAPGLPPSWTPPPPAPPAAPAPPQPGS